MESEAAKVSQAEQFASPRLDSMSASSANKQKGKVNLHDAVENDSTPSVSNCYVFKSRLQEYAQKAGLRTPVYETIKEGPSHEPFFRSAVIVDNVKYYSLPGFFNRKAAEQSAAEVALLELAKSVDTKYGISQPVHQTALSKNLLQEYAQKMNFAVPLYEFHINEGQGRTSSFSCTVEIGGIKYIGASASTKKEAEIKAARTALLAIQADTSAPEDRVGDSVYTVIPCKKKVTNPGINPQDTSATLKPKKGHFKKQQRKKRRGMKRGNGDGRTGIESGVLDAVGLPGGV
ncbi:Double-stranded RNA-binding protein 1 [Forsythia ovata]|uniref:Double-stranded RNA-binding protein 1 n=1 Tax=Forsythia ovata TaxID=205694 RepID=A0ABD1T4E8_9LAMI